MIRLVNLSAIAAIAFAVSACPTPYWFVEGSSNALEPLALTEEQPTITLEVEVTVTGESDAFIDYNGVDLDLGFDTSFAEELSELDVLIVHEGEQLALASYELAAGASGESLRAHADNFQIELGDAGSWTGLFEVTVVLLSGGPVTVTPKAHAELEGDDYDTDLEVQVLLEVAGEEAA
ncbi:MAG: hypothetical protein GY898_08300 [Proteobacteria bacterium]|nr:hypothetical protein [Pseudomonadota bacterium]